MKLKDWTVCSCCHCKKRHYFYGPLNEFEKEDFECCSELMQIIGREDWIVEDYIEIWGNILEDRNMHKYTDLGHQLYNSLNILDNITEISKNQIEKYKTEIIKKFMNEFLS